jgi:hypothetical protein
MVTGERTCNRCRTTKPLWQFALQGRHGRRAICKACVNLEQRQVREYDPENDAWMNDGEPSTMSAATQTKPWEMSCHACGELKHLMLTVEDARSVSWHIAMNKLDCHRCHGRLWIEPGQQLFTPYEVEDLMAA